MQKFTSDEEGSMEIIYRSRTSLWWGLAALVGWLFLLGPRLGWLVDLVRRRMTTQPISSTAIPSWAACWASSSA